MPRHWRWALASAAGTSHLNSGRGCEDAALVKLIEEPVEALVLAVSDGAGSADHARKGADIAVETFASTVSDLIGTKPFSALGREAPAIVDTIRYQITLKAKSLGIEPRQCACTFLGAVLTTHGAFFVQVGDGAIVTRRQCQPWSPVFWPQQGEFANTTFFVTQQEAAAIAAVQLDHAPVQALALLSDGVQSLSLDYAQRSAHAPFFDFVTHGVAQSTSHGMLADQSQDLDSFLTSDAVNSRTDDDKTLIVAFLADDPASR